MTGSRRMASSRLSNLTMTSYSRVLYATWEHQVKSDKERRLFRITLTLHNVENDNPRKLRLLWRLIQIKTGAVYKIIYL